METPQDFKDLLALFNAHKVEYIIVGAYALAFYGAPRFTGDMDLLVRPDTKNGMRIVQALQEFGFASLGLTAADFSAPDKVIQLGVAPARIDLLTSLTGVSWEEAAADRIEGSYGDLKVSFIGKAQFVRNKRATGRKKDLADLESIGET